MKICPQCMRQFDDEVDVCEDDGTRLRVFRDQASRVVGQILDGRWAIEEKIAEGGMGEVYRARQVTMERIVAVKLIRSGLAGSEEFVARFFREANILATIHHPHFVTIYDYGQAANEVLYIAMEYLHGVSLGERLETSRLGLPEIVKVGAQICAALEVAHKNQVVHRDLKPDNVFLVDVPDDIFVKVLDFGIAKQLDSDYTPVTKTGQVFGTPEYMSPEQCESVGGVDQRSDLYSLGVILYELLTGRLPYEGESAIKLMVEKISKPPIPIEDHGIPVPEPLAELVMDLLATAPEERPEDPQVVRERLDGVFEWMREHTEAVDAFSAATLLAGEHPDGGTRRFDSSALDKRREEVQRKLLASRKISWDQDDELPFADTRSPAPRSDGKTRTTLFITGALVLLLATGALALPQVRNAIFEPEAEPIPLGPSDDQIADAIAASIAGVALAAKEGELAPTRTAAVEQAEALKFDAAVFAASLPSTDEAASTTPAKPVPKNNQSTKSEAKTGGMLSLRTRTSIEKRARKLQGKLVQCYEARQDPEQAGGVSFEIRINPDGKVDFFKLTKNDFDDGVGTCVEKQVRTWTFRSSSLGSGFDTHARTVNFRRK